jgi:hypothetical protein
MPLFFCIKAINVFSRLEEIPYGGWVVALGFEGNG